MKLSKVVKFNDIELIPREDCDYQYNYVSLAEKIASGKVDKVSALRAMCRDDYFFFAYFVMGMKNLNCPYGVGVCKELNAEDPNDKKPILDLWAREHLKTSLIVTAGAIKSILKDPEERICLFSYSKSAAVKIMRPIKLLLESSEFLKWLFPDILYVDPERDSPKWSEELGITVRRRGVYREQSIEAWGLIEGMPTGSHYTKMYYDDIETYDTAKSDEMTKRLIEAFDVSISLGSDGGTYRALGTTYTHLGLLQKLRELENADGSKTFRIRVKPATHDGTENGEPVFISKERLEELKRKESFHSQQLLDPSPKSSRNLDFSKIKFLPPNDIPRNLYKFIIIDPANEAVGARKDSWAIHVVGVKPYREDFGASKIYLLDSIVKPMKHDEALKNIYDIYLRNGRIRALCIEKTGMSTMEIHIKKALLEKGILIDEKAQTLIILKPKGRKKAARIVENLMWSLNNSKVFFSTSISSDVVDRFKNEMNRFPFWHDDALDGFSYVQDVVKDYIFPLIEDEEEEYYDEEEDNDLSGDYNSDIKHDSSLNWLSCIIN